MRGLVGRDFWQTAKYLLSAIEGDLARWCVAEPEIGAEALELPSNRVPHVNPRESTWIHWKAVPTPKRNAEFGAAGVAASRNSIANALAL